VKEALRFVIKEARRAFPNAAQPGTFASKAPCPPFLSTSNRELAGA